MVWSCHGVCKDLVPCHMECTCYMDECTNMSRFMQESRVKTQKSEIHSYTINPLVTHANSSSDPRTNGGFSSMSQQHGSYTEIFSQHGSSQQQGTSNSFLPSGGGLPTMMQQPHPAKGGMMSACNGSARAASFRPMVTTSNNPNPGGVPHNFQQSTSGAQEHQHNKGPSPINVSSGAPDQFPGSCQAPPKPAQLSHPAKGSTGGQMQPSSQQQQPGHHHALPVHLAAVRHASSDRLPPSATQTSENGAADGGRPPPPPPGYVAESMEPGALSPVPPPPVPDIMESRGVFRGICDRSSICCNKVKPSSCKRRMIHAKSM